MAFVYREEQVDLGFGRGWLSRPAAESIRRIDAQIGHPLQISEAGRTWDQQNRFYQLFLSGAGAIALSPDAPSEHQKGKAVDSDEAQRILKRMEDNGWRRTVYRWINGKWTLVEDWHFEYFAELDLFRTASTATQATINPSEEDPDMPVNFRNPANGGITYTMVPGFSITAHPNAFGSRLTNYINNGVWPASESNQDRYNAGLRDLNSDHVTWMLGFYGFGRFNATTLPTSGTVYSDVIQGLMDNLGVAVTEAKATHGDTARIIDSITPGKAGVKFDGQLWARIGKQAA